MKRYLTVTVILCFIFFCRGYAQEPSYSIIGEEELAGIDIYSIVQDTAENIWLATNDALIKYDGYEFRRFTNSELKNRSLFGLKKDNYGQLFCYNLSGQIMTMLDDSLHLYFQVPDSLLIDNFSIAFDRDNNLAVAARKPFMVNKKKELSCYNVPYRANHFSVSANKEKDILVYENASYPLLQFKDDSLSIHAAPFDSLVYYEIIPRLNSDLFRDLNSFQIFEKTGDDYKEIHLQHDSLSAYAPHILYVTKNGNLWFSLRKEGMLAFDSSGNALFGGSRIFGNHYISGVLEDAEGNYWFTTLGNGILYFRSSDLLSYSSLPSLEKEKLLQVVFGEQGGVYVGSKSGKLFSIDNGNVKVVLNTQGIGVETLKRYGNYIITADDSYIHFIDANNNASIRSTPNTSSSIKDIHFISADRFVVATRTNTYDHFPGGKYPLFTGRSNSVWFDSLSGNYWVGSTKGLYLISGDQQKEVLFDGDRTMVTSFATHEGSVWAATSTDGIITLNDNSVEPFLNTSNGLLTDRIKKVKWHHSKLFISHNQGLQVYDFEKRTMETIALEDGLFSNNIIDFDLYENQLAVITGKGLQVLNLDNLPLNHHVPAIEFTSLKVNDVLTNLVSSPFFRYNDNKFEFEFRAKAYAHKGKLFYLYKLEGQDNYWQSTPFRQNKVIYNALPSGHYTFMVKAINEDGTESDTLKYTFGIMPPFWFRWWFITSVVVGFLLLVFIVYRRQLSAVKTKNRQKNELITSKLTAIRSQMNPHFVFNALNSIQDLILKQDIDKSYNYVVKFSNLLRNTLNFSDQDFITFEQEVELIELYLQLEKLRFKTHFNYSVETNNIDDILIPPMIIQPFIENAVKHGLLHKDPNDDKWVRVEFQLSEILTCTITDNGVGRARAKEIRERKGTKHESFSTQATKNRFEILQEHFKMDLGLEYEDLMENGKPSGTKVILRIPFRRQF